MDWYLGELERTGLSLIVYRNGEAIFFSRSSGISPHLEAIKKVGREALRGTVVADKIVGRAAALLILYAGSAEVHSMIVSSGGRELLEGRGVKLEFNWETPSINVRDGVILCPFERMVQGISDPEEAYEKIVEKLAELEKRDLRKEP